MEIGQPVSPAKQREIQEVVLALANWKALPAFPGTQPVTLDRFSLNTNVLKKKYFVSEKSDGFRYLMLIQNNGVYMIDALLRIRIVAPMKFPTRTNLNVQQHNTLLDGEIVHDKVDEAKFVLRYLVYDILCHNNQNIMNMKLPDRLKIIQNDVIWPRKNDFQSKYDYSKELFSVRLKDFYELKHVQFILKEMIPALPHANEGIIFTPLDFPYISGVNKHLLKWKPAHLNSIDFQLGVEWRERRPGYKLLIFDTSTKTPKDFSWITLSEDESNRASKAEGKIVECIWDSSRKTCVPKKGAETWEEGVWRDGGWKLIRVREDKKTPNDEIQFAKIMRSIEDNITAEELLALLVPKGEIKSPVLLQRRDSRTSINSPNFDNANANSSSDITPDSNQGVNSINFTDQSSVGIKRSLSNSQELQVESSDSAGADPKKQRIQNQQLSDEHVIS